MNKDQKKELAQYSFDRARQEGSEWIGDAIKSFERAIRDLERYKANYDAIPDQEERIMDEASTIRSAMNSIMWVTPNMRIDQAAAICGQLASSSARLAQYSESEE